MFHEDEFIQIGPDANGNSFIVRQRDITSIAMTDGEIDIEYTANGEPQMHSLVQEENSPKPSAMQNLVDILNNAPAYPKPEYDVLEIVQIQRGETSNSLSPMWRCYDADGRQVNIFDHKDADKHTFHLVEAAGYGDLFRNLLVDHTEYLEPADAIKITVDQREQYRQPISIAPRPPAPEPEPVPDSPPPADDESLTNLKDSIADGLDDVGGDDETPSPDEPDFVSAALDAETETTH